MADELELLMYEVIFKLYRDPKMRICFQFELHCKEAVKLELLPRIRLRPH